MTAQGMAAQLREWGGEGRWWQIRAAADYDHGLDLVLYAAILAGLVVVEPRPNPDDDIIRLRRTHDSRT